MKHIMNEIDLQTGKVLVSLLERIPHDTEDCDPKRILNITLNTLHIEKKRARSRRILKVISVIAACLVLAVSLPFAWPLLRQYIPMGETIPDDITLPCPMEEMYWKDNTPTSCHSGKNEQINGFMVSSSLAYALGAPETANRHLAIRMTKNDSKDIIHFLFNGKTVYEWHSEHEYWSSMLEKLRTLEKEGPALRYGEHLYTEGIPEDDPVCGSETWTKEHYDTRIAWYGQSFLERYIKDGIFDLKRASSDRNKAEKELATVGGTLPKAYRAYRQQSATGKETILHAQNISTLFLEGELYLFVTPSMFQTMKLEDKEDFTFYLAERNPFIDSGWLEADHET